MQKDVLCASSSLNILKLRMGFSGENPPSPRMYVLLASLLDYKLSWLQEESSTSGAGRATEKSLSMKNKMEAAGKHLVQHFHESYLVSFKSRYRNMSSASLIVFSTSLVFFKY